MTTETKPVKYSPSEAAFCLFLFRGMSQIDAYKAAFPRSQSWQTTAVYPRASTLANSTKIQARLSELYKTCEDPTISSVRERKQRLTTHQRANITDFIEPDGNLKPLSKDMPNSDAIREYSITESYNKAGMPIVRKHIKLADPIAAIETHNKMDRLYSDGTTNFNEIRVVVVRELPKTAQSAQLPENTRPDIEVEAKPLD